MEQWEYMTCFLTAEVSTKQDREFIEERFKKRAKRHSPESMIPELNQFGSAGWELVHMEPVAKVGNKEDVLFGTHQWSSQYFCVFKRRKPGSAMPIIAVTQQELAPPPPSLESPLPPDDDDASTQPATPLAPLTPVATQATLSSAPSTDLPPASIADADSEASA